MQSPGENIQYPDDTRQQQCSLISLKSDLSTANAKRKSLELELEEALLKVSCQL